MAEKWEQDQHIISEVAAYFEAKLAEFGVKLAPDFRPGNGHTIVGAGTIKVFGLDGGDRRVTLTVFKQAAAHVSYEKPPSKAALLGHSLDGVTPGVEQIACRSLRATPALLHLVAEPRCLLVSAR